jgi:two-component system, chemotaxis family, CheB/CheR fusion protein
MQRKKMADKKNAKGHKKMAGSRAKKVASSKATKTIRGPIIGLGASAGGLEALNAFFAEVPENSGMAFVVVVHMAPKQPSMMPELLQKVTCVSVSVAKDGQFLEPDSAYVIPPDKDISIYQGKIQLLDVVRKGVNLPIDSFLRSLALDQRANAAAIILSGTGTDGTAGVKEIQANDGLVMVQSEKTAKYDGMPASAIATGTADMVLAPEKMPEKLMQYFRHRRSASDQKPALAADDQRNWLNKIFAILRTQSGRDFSSYKKNTLLRRISRRMGLNQIESQRQYVRYLRENSAEVEALFRELLIGVTSFFRDPDSFDFLKESVFPDAFEQLSGGAPFRVWVPGCSTGEEVYSLAIIFSEYLGKNHKQAKLQLFGTDIDDRAVEKAREGLYPASIAADVNRKRLKRFFNKEGDFYRISKELRDCVVFSEQDLIQDPPFSRLNLLCCRNLLIYLDSATQKKLMPLFHYTLIPDGVLMLGSSETIGGFGKLFTTLDNKWKIFQRKEVPLTLRPQIDFPSGATATVIGHKGIPPVLVDRTVNIGRLARTAILNQFAPTALLIDAGGNILHVQGRTGKYLESPSGPPTQNVLDMAREGLRIELATALRAAKSTNQQVTRKEIAVRTNGDIQIIDLHVLPQQAPKEILGRFLVVFEDIKVKPVPPQQKKDPKGKTEHEAARISELERELQKTRESHQTTTEELESSNEELKSVNEEMQSANEELQSTNEELESSKEELQSLNEELQTVNAELQGKLGELTASHDDMHNLLNSIEIATIFVDNDMCIRRFTPKATDIINLIQTDIGRPLQHVATNLKYENMIADLTDVLKSLTSKETEVQTAEGKWCNMRILPYRTTDNRIDGAVLTFAFIGDQKKAQKLLWDANVEMEQTWQLVRNVFDMMTDPLVVLDAAGKMAIANTAMSDILDIAPEQIDGLDIFGLKNKMFDQTGLKHLLTNALKSKKDFKTKSIEIKKKDKKYKFVILGQIITDDQDASYRILLRFRITT